MISLFFIGYIFFLSSYLFLVVYLFYNWLKIREFKAYSHNEYCKVSIVVAMKNEAFNITNLLNSIASQSISPQEFELILINDHSTDDTKNVIENWHQNYQPRFKLSLQDSTGKGKKNALETGIKLASNEIILCTDADCIVPHKWVETYSKFFAQNKASFVFGQVKIDSIKKTNSWLKSLWYKWQQIEHAPLIGVGAASWKAGFPNMCNGANLAFIKKAFSAVNGYEGNTHIASGDDEFLMHKIYSRFPQEVHFLKSTNACVSTQPCETWHQFALQRTRWTSKWEMYQDVKIKLFALFIFGTNLATVIGLYFLPYLINSQKLVFVWILLMSRWILEYFFIKAVMNSLQKELKIWAYISLLPLYSLYVAYFALAGRFIKFKNPV